MKPTTMFAGLGLLSALCLALLLAGCGNRAQGEGDCGSGAACEPAANASTASSPTTNSELSEPPPPTRETTPEDIGPDGPPDSTLSYGGRTVAGQPGSYCWSSGGSGGCIDAALTVPEETLRVSEGTKLRFNYGGRSTIEVKSTAYQIRRNDRVNYPGGAWSLKRVEDRNKTSILLDLPPSEYLLEVFVRVPQGDAAYYFRIIVRPDVTEDADENTRETTASAGSLSQGVVAAPPPGATTPARDNSSLYSGSYEATKDGDLIYGGDVILRCEELVKMGAPAKPGSEDSTSEGNVMEPLTREAVELCARAGFPPEGATF